MEVAQNPVVMSHDLRRRKGFVIKGRVRVGNEEDVVAEGHGAPASRVDAVVGLQARDDDAPNAASAQKLVKVSAEEGICKALRHHRIAGTNVQRSMDETVGRDSPVRDEDDERAGGTGPRQEKDNASKNSPRLPWPFVDEAGLRVDDHEGSRRYCHDGDSLGRRYRVLR